MNGKDIIMGAADLGVGIVTGDAISEALGGGVSGFVGSLVGGAAAGSITHQALNAVDKETGIVSDLGSLVDDVFSIF